MKTIVVLHQSALIFLLMLVTAALSAGVAYAEGFESSKRVGIYKVTLKMASHSLPAADNKATISVSDGSGPVACDDLRLYYFMPSMPAMNYETKAVFRDNVYEAVIKPTMPGAWTVEVRVKGADGNTHKAAFDFQAK
jgi:hypothetical protein